MNSNILVPYDYFVASFTQSGTSAPVLSKIIYNGFSVTPEFDIVYNGAGSYTIEISNYDSLNITPLSKAITIAKIDYSGSVENKIESFLSTSHYSIDVTNYYLPFSSRQDIGGKFILIYIKLK